MDLHLPCPLGIQQQLLGLADVVLSLCQNGINIGEAANTILDFICQVSDLERRSWDGELQNLVCHSLDAIWIRSLLWLGERFKNEGGITDAT